MFFRAPAAALCSAILALAACGSPPPLDAHEPPAAAGEAMGAVQREIRVGMGQPDEIAALGPPNRVSTDSQHREVWTYDQVSSDRVDTSKSVGGGIVVLGSARQSAPSSASQRTLTLNIYYDDEKKVREIAYNYSSIQPASE